MFSFCNSDESVAIITTLLTHIHTPHSTVTKKNYHILGNSDKTFLKLKPTVLSNSRKEIPNCI